MQLIQLSKRFILSTLVLALAACQTSQPELEQAEAALQEEFTYQLEVAAPASSGPTSRTDVRKLRSLKLLVFDENNKFIYSRDAILKKVVAAEDNSFYPPSQHSPKEVYTYAVKLFSSNLKRTIHFIANYDGEIEQDYFLEGLDAGQVLAGLSTSNTAYWRAKTYENLTERSFKSQQIILLSNQAKIEILNRDKEFELEEIGLYNAYNKGTVASFYWEEDQLGYFPTHPTQPTIPAEVEPVPEVQFVAGNSIYTFEHENLSNKRLSIILKGRFKNSSSTCYFKLDLKKKNLPNGQSQLHSLIRNQAYRFSIDKIDGQGYPTLEDAINNPPSNNLFGSVELEHFNKVSDGVDYLEVKQLRATLVQEGQEFSTEFVFTKPLADHVKLYPSWDEANDPYLGRIELTYAQHDARIGQIKLRAKSIPTDRNLSYQIDIVGQTEQGQYITRQVQLLVRPPYDFKAQLVPTGNGLFDLSFDLPVTLQESALPLSIYIESPQMMPQDNKNYLLSYQEGRYYYRYTLVDASELGKRVHIPFIKVSSNQEPQVHIRLVSDYFQTASLSSR